MTTTRRSASTAKSKAEPSREDAGVAACGVASVESAAGRATRERRAQGLSEHVCEAKVLSAVAHLVRVGR